MSLNRGGVSPKMQVLAYLREKARGLELVEQYPTPEELTPGGFAVTVTGDDARKQHFKNELDRVLKAQVEVRTEQGGLAVRIRSPFLALRAASDNDSATFAEAQSNFANAG